ncbi:TPA: type 1 fimbrial protein [Enterobacter bugandensis]|nr:type 1 fimbrial protein [Enterobacter bugandensis]
MLLKWCCLNLMLWSGVIYVSPVKAITLNFNAFLTDATCSLSLNKSSINLGTVKKNQLKPEQVVALQPFTLSVQQCANNPDSSLTPTIIVKGAGVLQDNKWIFRNSGSAAGVGVLVFQSDSIPAYSADEIKDNSKIIAGNKGSNPSVNSLNFYAGLSCGGSAGCASSSAGDVVASLIFTFAYH